MFNMHFEDFGDAVTDIDTTLDTLTKMGVKKVVSASNYTFTQYEEVKARTDIEIIPAIKLGFEEPDSMITLIAKNTKGYHSLCKIITEANSLNSTIIQDKTVLKHILYLENLKDNISKGDIIVTFSANDGYFCKKLKILNNNLDEQIKKLEDKLSNIKVSNGEQDFNCSYKEIRDVVYMYSQLPTIKKPTKADIKFAEQDGDYELTEQLKKDLEQYKREMYIKKNNAKLVKELKQTLKGYNKDIKLLNELKEKNENLKGTKKALIEKYKELEEIVGAENIFFELANHKDEEENKALLSEIEFTKEIGNRRFIINNESVIGVQKNDKRLPYEKQRLTIAKSLKLKKQVELNNIEEYAIKTDEEEKADIIELMQNDKLYNIAYNNTQKLLNSFHLEKEEEKKHYPKFCDNEDEEFIKAVHEGISDRFPNGMTQEYIDRMNYEIDIITSMGYSGYHLIVQDYIKYGRLLGYLDESEIEKAPLTIEGLDEYLTKTNSKRIGIGVGDGRGSAAGSLCCYLLGITNIDPIKNELYFERFLNPERVSMPDIDTDFLPNIRSKMRDYIRNRYGSDCVSEIITKSYPTIKGAIKSAGTYLGYIDKSVKWTPIVDRLRAELMEYNKGEEYSYDLDGLLKYYEEQTHKTNWKDEELKLLSYARYCVGMFSGYSMHAAGTIISKDKVSDEMPMKLNASTQNLETQCPMNVAEDKGYLKMDILGLNNLRIITDAMKMANLDPKTFQDVNVRDKHLAEKNLYTDIFSKSLTDGVFQFESYGVKLLLKKFEPENFDDVILINALNRPGPLDYADEMSAMKWYSKNPEYYNKNPHEFYEILREHNIDEKKNKHLYNTPPKQTIQLDNDDFKAIVKNTYGCPIYQEQIMQIFQTMAGYSLGRADEVRRFMSKKKMDKLKHERKNFIYGNGEEIKVAKEKLQKLKEEYTKNPTKELKQEIENYKIPKKIEGSMKKQNLTEKQADDLFDQMLPFAKYGFNKSHSSAYAVIAVETAWLKKHYPKEFYASLFTHINTQKKNDKLPQYIKEMKKFGIKLIPPNLNALQDKYTVNKEGVVYPISQTKGMSKDKIQNIKPKSNIYNFIRSNPHISLSILKKLIQLGCFDKRYSYKTKEKIQREEKLVNHSSTVLTRFAEENYTNIQKLQTIEEKMNTKGLTDKELNKLIKNREKILNTLKEHEKRDSTTIPIVTDEEYIQEKQDLIEILCYDYVNDYDIERLRQVATNTTIFKEVEGDIYKKHDIWLTILSVPKEPSYTKTSHKPYYPIKAVDQAGEVRTLRFNTNKGFKSPFKYTINGQLYFTNILSESMKKGLTENETKDIVQKITENKINDNRQTKVIPYIKGINEEKEIIIEDYSLS